MAVSSREIKRRIKSVKNIGQITKAMELVSAAKMRKAQSQATASRPYAVLSSELLRNLAARTDITTHPLVSRVIPQGIQPQNKTLVILVSSDRGLAGSLNTNIINQALSAFRNEVLEKIEFISIGKKGADAVRKAGFKLVAHFPIKEKSLSVFDAKPISEIAIDGFLKFTYDRVIIIYTDFISTLVQKPNTLQLLPLSASEKADNYDVVIEPDADEVLDHLIYRTIEFAVYQSLVEASASEHSARMVAMRNANQAASDLIEDLTLSANQARQASITRELAEISAAKLAMEG